MENIVLTSGNYRFVEKLVVGFNKRSDTYTDRLGFVSYYKPDGEMYLDGVMSSWRDHSMPFEEMDNVPTNGFVVNGTAGGGNHRNAREIKYRIFDPRGFEIEIPVWNHTLIHEYCDLPKGKAIDGELVYVFNGRSINLLPVISKEYKDIMEGAFNTEDIKNQYKDKPNIDRKDLVPHQTYVNNKSQVVLFTGGDYGLDRWIFLHDLTTGDLEIKNGFIEEPYSGRPKVSSAVEKYELPKDTKIILRFNNSKYRDIFTPMVMNFDYDKFVTKPIDEITFFERYGDIEGQIKMGNLLTSYNNESNYGYNLTKIGRYYKESDVILKINNNYYNTRSNYVGIEDDDTEHKYLILDFDRVVPCNSNISPYSLECKVKNNLELLKSKNIEILAEIDIE